VPQTKRPGRVRAAGALGSTIKIRRADRTPTPEEIQRADVGMRALARLLAADIDDAELPALAEGGAPCA